MRVSDISKAGDVAEYVNISFSKEEKTENIVLDTYSRNLIGISNKVSCSENTQNNSKFLPGVSQISLNQSSPLDVDSDQIDQFEYF